MPEGWLSFLFPTRNKTDAPRLEPSAEPATNTPLPNQSAATSDSVHTRPNSALSAYRGDLQSPSPPPSTANLSASPPLSHHDVIRPPSHKSSRPVSGRRSAPLSGGSRMKAAPSTSSLSPTRAPGSPFKLPPSPASLTIGLPIPPAPYDLETKTVEELKSLLRNVPAKTLHDYLASRLSVLPPSELISLSSVLSELEPPPLLHCVRCHKDFTEVENTDYSCTIQHDDDSAVVQYARSKTKAGTKGQETFWGCCGQTVEGKGELGPPSGWCYEGKHTVDVKRARWRDDSTIYDDKLISCEVKRCFVEEEPVTRPKTRKRERGRKRLREEDDEGDDHRSVRSKRVASPSPSAVSVRSTRSTKRRASPPVSVRSAKTRLGEASPTIEMSPPVSVAASAPPLKKPKSRAKPKAPKTPKTPVSVAALPLEDPTSTKAKKTKTSSMRPRSQSVVSTTSAAGTSAKARRKQILLEASERASTVPVQQVSDSEAEREKEKPTQKTKKRKLS